MKNSAGKAVVLLILVTAITKVFGFIREILFGRWYGVGEIAEAFKIAQTIPMMLLLIIGTGISTGFIPIYSKIKNNSDEAAADRFLSNLINILIIISIIFSVFVTLFPDIFVKLFASGFQGSKYELTIHFTRIAVWGTIFNMMTYLLVPYLQMRNQYLVPALMVIPGNIVFIVCFYIGKEGNPTIVALSIVIAIVVQLIWLLPFVLRSGYKWEFYIDHKNKSVRNFIYLATPVIIGVAINQLNLMVDKNIASIIMDGGVAILDYANRMTNFVQAIFVYPFSAVLFPKITKFILEKNFKNAEESTTNSLVFLSMIILPCSVGLMVYSEPIISLLFEGDVFTKEAVTLTAQAMLFYSFGLLFWGLRDILVRVYYAFGNTKTPTINAIIGVIINIILNLVLSRFFSLNGLAIATSISAVISCILMFINLKHFENFKLNYKQIFSGVAKTLFSTIIMGTVAYFSYYKLFINQNGKFKLLIGILISILSYIIVIYFMKIKELDEVLIKFTDSKQTKSIK